MSGSSFPLSASSPLYHPSVSFLSAASVLCVMSLSMCM